MLVLSEVFGPIAISVVYTDTLSSPQTAKDDTAYTQVSDKPDDSSETPASQPMRNGSYIAMSPVEAQKCWLRIPSPTVELRKRAEGTAPGCYITMGGGLHTQLAHFHFILGLGGVWGKQWGTNPTNCVVNKDITSLTEPCYDCLPSSTYWAWPSHPAGLHHNQLHTLILISVLVGPKDEGTLNGLGQDKPSP